MVLQPVGQKLFASIGKADALESDYGPDHPGFVQSIGAKRTPKVLDPYHLDTYIMRTLDDGYDTDLHSLSDRNSTSIRFSLDCAPSRAD
ncbi:hypothetical protein N0V83_004432 [Neocucurbitaria cava]|uniref:Uncharacterized protein n=1 Tax=Neocucurbitaria cava TaxID=798079 RepID=A0A9W8Y9N3_9PLEO|nr:hypothetical protein N0V83_004432 [Neocucurbitaria cava]